MNKRKTKPNTSPYYKIFGYIIFELDKPFDVEDEKPENMLLESILNFFEENNIVAGKLREIEIGKREAHLVLLDDDGEVIEWI